MGMVLLQSLTTVDYAILAILVVAVAIGWARGLVELLTGFVVFFVAATVAGRYADQVVGWLNRLWGVRERLAGVLARRINLPPDAYRIHTDGISWQKALEWLQFVPLPQPYKLVLAQRIATWSTTAGHKTVAEFIVQQLAAGVLHALVFLLLILVIGWLLSLLGRLVSDQVKELPLVGPTNRLLGAAVSVAETAVGIAIVIGLLTPVLSMYGMPQFGTAVGTAHLTPYFLSVFHWLQGGLFGLTGNYFFVMLGGHPTALGGTYSWNG
jgi:uncharacterized membrane protein required for colicin V production